MATGDVDGPPKCNVVVSYNLWHQRLGHPNRQVLNKFLHDFSIPVVGSKTNTVCNSCYSNKSHSMPFSKGSLHSVSPLNLIYDDLWGPSPVISIGKKRYYVLFVDQFSRYMWLFTLKAKTEVLKIFKTLHPMLERHFQTKILSLYTNGEF